MLDWLLPEQHAIAILKKDHDTVKELFDKFEKAETSAQKEKIITAALTELKIHAVIEEEIFYPTVRKHVGNDIMNEADEEHHVAKVLIAELESPVWRPTTAMRNSPCSLKVFVTTSRKKKAKCSPRPRSSTSISRRSARKCSIARPS